MNILESYEACISACKIPSEAYNFDPPQEIIVIPSGGKIPLRNIFHNQKFLSSEVEKLNRLKDRLRKEKITVPEGWDDVDLIRVIHGSGFKTRKAFSDFKESVEAFAKHIPSDIKVLYPKSIKLLVNFI